MIYLVNLVDCFRLYNIPAGNTRFSRLAANPDPQGGRLVIGNPGRYRIPAFDFEERRPTSVSIIFIVESAC